MINHLPLCHSPVTYSPAAGIILLMPGKHKWACSGLWAFVIVNPSAQHAFSLDLHIICSFTSISTEISLSHKSFLWTIWNSHLPTKYTIACSPPWRDIMHLLTVLQKKSATSTRMNLSRVEISFPIPYPQWIERYFWSQKILQILIMKWTEPVLPGMT